MESQALPGPEVWLDERLAVRASPIEGRGLFAIEPIAARTVVLRLGGRLVGSAELTTLIRAADADPTLPYVDSIAADGDLRTIAGHAGPLRQSQLRSGTVARRRLRGVDPARRGRRRGADARLRHHHRRRRHRHAVPVRRGDLPGGEVTSQDWRRPDLRARYRGHWAAALQARIDALAPD